MRQSDIFLILLTNKLSLFYNVISTFMFWKDLATTYSGVSLAFLAVIAYFIKRHYDLKSKKIEIQHSLFQQNKITAIVYYLSSYIHMDKVVHKMFIGNSVSIPIQLEEELVTSTNNFKIALTQLNLYLSPIEMNDYRRLFMNFFGIGPYVERWKLSDDNVEEQQNSAILVKYLQHILLDNATAIEAIGYSTRRMFHS